MGLWPCFINLKKIFGFLVIAFVFSLSACRAAPSMPPKAEEAIQLPKKTDSPAVDLPKSAIFEMDWNDRTPFESGLASSYQSAFSELDDASIYFMDLILEDDLQHLDGRQEIRYTNQENDSLSEVVLRLFPNLYGGWLHITSLKINGQTIEPAYTSKDSALRIPLHPSLKPGGQIVIQLEFQIFVPTDGSSNYNTYAYTNDVLALAQFYPLIPAYDEKGWYTGIPPQDGDITYTDSSFFLVRLSTPDNLTVVSSGSTIDEKKMNARKQLTIAAGPIRDFYIAASSRYEKSSLKIDTLTINSYYLPELKQNGEAALQYAADAISIFSDHFADYPYTEFDIIGTPNLALGVEYPGMTVITNRIYDPDNRVGGNQATDYLEGTVVHEVAHQWFYNLVGNDQINDPWLDEATAQYATSIYYRDHYTSSAETAYRQSWYSRWERVNREEIPIGLPVSAYQGAEYGAIVYGRGPLFLEAMSEAMGEEKFNQFLKKYVTDFTWKNATAADFKALAEETCSCDLNPLFIHWVIEK